MPAIIIRSVFRNIVLIFKTEKVKQILEKAIQIAVNAHFGQKDRSGVPYIFHPLRVMHSVDTFEAKIVAVLHDVVEDTDWTYDRLTAEGIPKHLVITIRHLTRDKNISYEDYIAQVAENPLAARVKMADLKDNMDTSRLKDITEEDMQRLKMYISAYSYLKKSFPQLT